jgi:hypothetical protein
MPERGRNACGLTQDDVIALTDDRLVGALYGAVGLLEYGKPASWAVIDTIYLLLDELTERHVPEARWAEHERSYEREPEELEPIREAMREREGARILRRELGDAR